MNEKKTQKSLYIVSTDNYHKADLYKMIFDRLLPGKYVSSIKKFVHHDYTGAEDIWYRWKFAAKVDKYQEADLRNLIHRADLPGFYL